MAIDSKYGFQPGPGGFAMEERGRMRLDQLTELLRGLDMEEPHDQERTRRDEMTPRREVHFTGVPESESREELRTALSEVHDLPEVDEDFRGY
eukprot:2593286-Rhodomonas_salina.1